MKRIARRAYAGGVWVLAAAVVAQFLLAGLGIFADRGFLTWHATAGAAVVLGLALLLVLIGWLGGMPGRRLWLTGGIAGLVIVQSLLLVPYHMNATGVLRAVAGLHVVNGLVIFWAALRLLEVTLSERSSAPEATPRPYTSGPMRGT
jgi:Family of unknown function (DUF6220)